jgi:integrase
MPTLGLRPMQQIGPTEIDSLFTRLEGELSARAVHPIHTVFSACLNAAVRKGLIVSNPVKRAEPPSPSNEETGQVFEQERLAALLNGFRGSALYPIVATAAFTGARRNEILALRWSVLDMAAKTLTIRRSLEETKVHGVRFKEPATARGVRSIAIDDHLVALLSGVRERYLRLAAGVADGVAVDLSLVKLPEEALRFPSPPLAGVDFDFTRPRNSRGVTKEFARRARKLGFAGLRLLDADVPVHVVAGRCGDDPAVLLRVYAKRTKKADASAAAIIGALSKSVPGG